jgi:hypothetical protein
MGKGRDTGLPTHLPIRIWQTCAYGGGGGLNAVTSTFQNLFGFFRIFWVGDTAAAAVAEHSRAGLYIRPVWQIYRLMVGNFRAILLRLIFFIFYLFSYRPFTPSLRS